MGKWFYVRRGKLRGPVTDNELDRLAEAGELLAEDPIWRVGQTSKDAAQAGSVLVFFLSGAKPKPPEPPPEPPRPAKPSAAPAPDWLQDVRRAEEARRPPGAGDLPREGS